MTISDAMDAAMAEYQAVLAEYQASPTILKRRMLYATTELLYAVCRTARYMGVDLTADQGLAADGWNSRHSTGA